MAINQLLGHMMDPYDRKARAFPALLVLLPLLVPFLLVFGPKSAPLTSLVTLLVGCGAVYAIANVARARGKSIERQLFGRWGGSPTTALLRHRNPFLDDPTKARYHAKIAAVLGVTFPTAAEEHADPIAADHFYMGVTRQLRELCRGKPSKLLVSENIAYGFNRNMYGMRPLGLTTSIVGFACGLVLSKVVILTPLSFTADGLSHVGIAGGATLAVSGVLFVAWLFFNESTVKEFGYAYAERLFECAMGLPKRNPRSASQNKKKEASI